MTCTAALRTVAIGNAGRTDSIGATPTLLGGGANLWLPREGKRLVPVALICDL